MIKSNKAFTLVELLTVLVILAILSLITIPIILNVIKNTKLTSDKRSAEAYMRALDYAVVQCLNKHPNEDINELNMHLKTDGRSIYLLNDEVDNNLNDNNKCIDINYKGNKKIDGINDIVSIKRINNKISVGDGIKNLKIGTYTFNINDGEINEAKSLPKSISLEKDSWDTITTLIKSGQAPYKIGETKKIKVGVKEFTVRLSNKTTSINCNKKDYSQTACGYVFEFEDIYGNEYYNPALEDNGKQYSDGWNKGGYPGSDLYKYLQNNLFNLLSKELRDNIIETKVVSSHGYDDNSNFQSFDKLYLLSPTEVYGSSFISEFDTSINTTRQLDFYAENNVTVKNASLAIKKLNNEKNVWWLRSAYANNKIQFYKINSNGDCGTIHAKIGYGISPAFRIG